MAEMLSPEQYCKFGRPHWGALATQFGENVCSILDVMRLARAKLQGGIEPSSCDGIMIAQNLAILGIRVCVDLVPQCQLSHELVAQHMRTMYHISGQFFG
jgi:hypothetical protein